MSERLFHIFRSVEGRSLPAGKVHAEHILAALRLAVRQGLLTPNEKAVAIPTCSKSEIKTR